MISSPRVKKVILPYTEEQMSLIDAAMSIPNKQRVPAKFTEEADYVILKFYQDKPHVELARLLKTARSTLELRYKEIIADLNYCAHLGVKFNK
jgi:hypothetical protein